jgi:sugar phosphate isomerase/epimerase
MSAMRPGVSGSGMPVETLLVEASRAGMSHLEIDLNDERNELERLTPQRCTSIGRIARELALTLSLHSPYTLNLCDRVPALRRASVEFLRRCLDVADRIRATHITIHPGFYNGPQEPGHRREEARSRLVDSIREVAAGRPADGAIMALETTSPAPVGSMFSLLGVDLADFDFAMAALPSPAVAMCLDLGHTNLCAGGPLPYLERFARRIVAIHYHDNHGEIDEHLLPGEGTVPWARAIRGLLDVGYGGPWVSEVSDVPAQDAWKALTSFAP